MTVRVPCEQCGEHFAPAKPWARFCSPECRLHAHRVKNRVVATSGLAAAEEALAGALDEVRRGRRDRALEHARRAVAQLAPRRRARSLDNI